jgi:two-component system, NtrC family, nitrogen regulation sensor histidine kinase NtrY
MRTRLHYAAAGLTLLVLIGLVIWQGSFNMGKFGPANTAQVFLYWAMSTLVFLLMVTLGFMLFRIMVRLYVERTRDREGSHIKTKLVTGALLLSFLPVVFMVLWSYQVLNINIQRWFSRPAENIRMELVNLGESIMREANIRGAAQARWLAGLPEVETLAQGGAANADAFEKICEDNDIVEAHLEGVLAGKPTMSGAANGRRAGIDDSFASGS